MENTNLQVVIIDVPDIENKNIQILPFPKIKQKK